MHRSAQTSNTPAPLATLLRPPPPPPLPPTDTGARAAPAAGAAALGRGGARLQLSHSTCTAAAGQRSRPVGQPSELHQQHHLPRAAAAGAGGALRSLQSLTSTQPPRLCLYTYSHTRRHTSEPLSHVLAHTYSQNSNHTCARTSRHRRVSCTTTSRCRCSPLGRTCRRYTSQASQWSCHRQSSAGTSRGRSGCCCRARTPTGRQQPPHCKRCS